MLSANATSIGVLNLAEFPARWVFRPIRTDFTCFVSVLISLYHKVSQVNVWLRDNCGG
jgi:hypothetical protein